MDFSALKRSAEAPNGLFIAAVMALGVYLVVFTETVYFVAHFAGLVN